MSNRSFDTWQWLTILGAILASGVGVTVFAFNTFEAKGSSDALEKKLDPKIDLIYKNQIRMMIKLKVEPIIERE